MTTTTTMTVTLTTKTEQEWAKLEAGYTFVLKHRNNTSVYVKMRTDPFGAPIGDIGVLDVMTGEEHVLMSLISFTEPLFDQIIPVHLEVRT